MYKNDVVLVKISTIDKPRLFFRLSIFKKLLKAVKVSKNDAVFYIIEFKSGFIKIGITDNYKTRLKNYSDLEQVMDNKILKLDAFTCNSSNVKQHETNIIKRLQALYPFKMNEWFKTNDFESVRKIVVAELFKNN